MLEQIYAYLLPTLGAVLLAVLSFVGRALYNFIKERTKNTILLGLNEVLNIAVQETVDALDQEVVNKLKEASEDGKLTKEEIEMIRNEAITRIKVKLSSSILDMLGDYFENVTQLIIDKIEAYLDEKRTQAMRFFEGLLGEGED